MWNMTFDSIFPTAFKSQPFPPQFSLLISWEMSDSTSNLASPWRSNGRAFLYALLPQLVCMHPNDYRFSKSRQEVIPRSLNWNTHLKLWGRALKQWNQLINTDVIHLLHTASVGILRLRTPNLPLHFIFKFLSIHKRKQSQALILK